MQRGSRPRRAHRLREVEVIGSSKTVLVTGASTGIGRACVLHLAARGHTVFAGVRKEPDGTALRDAGGDLLVPLILDVTDGAAIDAAAATIGETVGERGLDGLVNNAGVARGGPVEYLPVESWRMQLEVNVIGQIAVTRAMMPLLRRATGRIVFIGSIGGRMGAPMMGPYNASKFALEGICEAFRHELRPFGMKVVLIEPGAIRTEIWAKGRSQADELQRELPTEASERYASHIKFIKGQIDRSDRMGIAPERVAKVVERALTTQGPRARYLVGIDAKIGGHLSRIMPDAAKDAIFRRLI